MPVYGRSPAESDRETRHDVAEQVDAPVERFATTVADTDVRVRKCEPLGLWQEAVAYRERDGTLYVPDLLGGAPGYAVGDERVGVVLSDRLRPPRGLVGDLDPERILVGHGEGVFEDAETALTATLDGARRRFPRAVIEGFGPSLRSLLAAMR